VDQSNRLSPLTRTLKKAGIFDVNHEEILEAVEKRVGPLDERDQAVAQAMLDILAQKEPPLSPNAAETRFEGENVPMEQWATLTPEERGQFLQALEERNKEWLARKFQQLRAGWLVILDGDVSSFGVDLSDSPTDQELYAQGEQLGRCPLLFINDILLAIEEPAAAWQATTLVQDFYPGLPITLADGGALVNVEADFDTGSFDVFADWDVLESQGLVQPQPGDTARSSFHLSQPYVYLRRKLRVGLTAEDGSHRETTQLIICVRHWTFSPFVRINPTRTALVGRGLCLSLAPEIKLDFAQHLTTLSW